MNSTFKTGMAMALLAMGIALYLSRPSDSQFNSLVLLRAQNKQWQSEYHKMCGPAPVSLYLSGLKFDEGQSILSNCRFHHYPLWTTVELVHTGLGAQPCGYRGYLGHWHPYGGAPALEEDPPTPLLPGRAARPIPAHGIVFTGRLQHSWETAGAKRRF